MEVFISDSTSPKRRYFQYSVDTILGRLVASGSDLPGVLFKSLLHALTSHVIRDDLTGRTGTEEALATLSSSTCKTTSPLSADSLDILQKIGDLTPVRKFYPYYLPNMQSVSWNEKLSPLAQHERFALVVQDVLAYNARFKFLCQDGIGAPTKSFAYGGDLALLQRALELSSHLYSFSSWSCPPRPTGDAQYRVRDKDANTAQESALELANTVMRWPSKLPVVADIHQSLADLGSVAGFDQAFNVTSISKLLQRDLASVWGSVLNLCKKSHQE